MIVNARLLTAWTALLLALWPSQVLACAVCRFGDEDPSLDAYFISVIFMSLVPLAIIGGSLYYIYRRARQAAATPES